MVNARALLLSLLVPFAACATTTIKWHPSLASQVPDSVTVRFAIAKDQPATQGLALDWQRGRPRVVTGRDTIIVPNGAALEVRLPEKSGHPTAGGVLGWVFGVGLSYALCPAPKTFCGEEDPTPLLGAGIGALIGSKIKTDQWVGVRWDTLRAPPPFHD